MMQNYRFPNLGMWWRQNFKELFFRFLPLHFFDFLTFQVWALHQGFQLLYHPTRRPISNSLDKIKSVNVSRNLFCNAKPKLWKGCKNLKIALCDRPVQGIRGAWQITWGLSSSSIRNVTHAYQGDYQSRGALNQVLYGRALPQGPPPQPFIYHLREKRYLFCALFIVPFQRPSLKCLIP